MKQIALILLTIFVGQAVNAQIPLTPGSHWCDDYTYHSDNKDEFCDNNYGRYFPPASVCYTGDAHGLRYRALARGVSNASLAQQALSTCRSRSSAPKSCYLLGCDHIHR